MRPSLFLFLGGGVFIVLLFDYIIPLFRLSYGSILPFVLIVTIVRRFHHLFNSFILKKKQSRRKKTNKKAKEGKKERNISIRKPT